MAIVPNLSGGQANNAPIVDTGLTSSRVIGDQQITSLSASTALTVPTGATMAIIQPEAQAVRWRDNGQTPTTPVGQRITVGGELRYTGDLTKLRFIEETASAKLNVTYYA